MSVKFLLDGDVVEIAPCDPTGTLLEYLRGPLRRTGTKEGCAEGDCGACTVLVGELAGDQVQWRAVNACIAFLPMLHGKALMTVESLARGGALNPLQACMAANGSSQCGFCTPGFVMSLHGRAIGALGSELPVADVIAGNLCRCTGYGPILEAGETVSRLVQDDSGLAQALAGLADDGSGTFEGRQWFAPRSSQALADILAAHPDARIVAGATDVGLWVTKGLRDLQTVVFIGDVADLKGIEETSAGLRIGAGVRYAQAHAAMARLHPDLGELVRRIGGLQVRSSATVCGNIANGSPIGDGPPALIALGAELTLRSAAGRRTMPLEDYFLDYGKQDRQPGEFVESVFVPRPTAGTVVHISKLSRRFDSDISAVLGAFSLTVEGGMITAARVAFGGMAATPRRAKGCEAALVGKPFVEATIAAAAEALRGDFQPLTDVRGTSAYRIEAAAGLLWRLWHREQGTGVCVLDVEAC
ncbi:MAG: xanthine dehydrogenase small subunit [Novosphingobium sp. 28-62-57]|uniref:xanthine dehydrogenase small subunit n=1 Tax=unclassified Novosphingobium TaxID=2644732 RepID=UPI000BDD3A48|nr:MULTISPECIES: xanthine dehydrogenase small subunit [unclassified Novosphingobium]OYW49959.1 MAG: xanthine dehydrogenase small subunit [Novosphingobium sp. 12-62-10]OYZ12113.1 MAG: xanthine dehydrogenase small subunit [Novosphingobium sp. 28-62-57]HQS69530.1 xanthine dehydrogenase small subunit [Novosphingobium sp.]